MTIDEEIKILENALSGALLAPSECAFVNTQVIKICLDTLKTYESWENLIRYEIENQIRADAIDDFEKSIITEIRKWYFDADKQEIANDPCVVDALTDLFIRTVQDTAKAEKERDSFEYEMNMAYKQGWNDAIDEFARAYEKVEVYGCTGCKHLDDDIKCWECIAEQLKEQK